MRSFVFLNKFKNREEVFSLSVSGVQGVWKEAGDSFVRRREVVTELIRMNVSIFYFFWQEEEGRWVF